MNTLPVKRAHLLEDCPEENRWLIHRLWADQAVGIIGGEPKCCKSFLALDIAVSVASGKPCLRAFAVNRPGSVLLYAAEDALRNVRARLEGICRAKDVLLENLQIHVITAPRLLLDDDKDASCLAETIKSLNPRLLVLDPLIRMHRLDENSSSEMARILGFLRDLQREHGLAIALVHHARKGAAHLRPGQALRGSSDFHGWGDSNLYIHRSGNALSLTIEHRSAPDQHDIPLELVADKGKLALAISQSATPAEPHEPERESVRKRILDALRSQSEPVPLRRLRLHCRMRTESLSDGIAQLLDSGHVLRHKQGYALNPLSAQTG